MSRTVHLLLAFVVCGATATADPRPAARPDLLALQRLANVFAVDLLPARVIDHLVHVEHDARDVIQSATARAASYLSGLAIAYDLHAADLTILTTEPLTDALSKSSGYGWRSDPMHHDRRFHHGADMRADYGTPVVAAGDGVVVFAGRQGGYGNVVYIDHGGGIVTRYGHLQRIDTRKDATLTAGQRIGQVGSTGRATGPHLHFEVRIDGRDVNPMTAMTVAELQRTQPDAGRVAAFALDPELQKRSISIEDKKVDKAETSSAKPIRAKRAQILW